MNVNDFNRVVEHQLGKCTQVLVHKAEEYADDVDRLHNFKQAAHLERTTPVKALAGMMVKHTVSVYDMCHSDETFTLDQWTEKITDHINYLLLLKAALVEDELTKANPNQSPLIDI